LLFELVSNLSIDVSFFYLSLVVLMTVFVIAYVSELSSRKFFHRGYIFYETDQLLKVNREQISQPLACNEDLIAWLRITFERPDDQDDESDSASSYMQQNKYIRGGQLCQNNSYSSSVEFYSERYY